MATFTERELDIMAVLWDNGPSTVAEVRARLPDRLAHNTVLTVLTILEHKGFVRHTEEGKAHRFHARVKREKAGALAIAKVVNKMFGGSPAPLLTQLVDDDALKPEEVRRLRKLLAEKARRGKE